LGGEFHLKLVLLWLHFSGAIRRYWIAYRHTAVLLALVWRYANIIRRFEEDAAIDQPTGLFAICLNLLNVLKLGALLQSFEAYHDNSRREVRRLRRIYAQLKQSELRRTGNVSVLATRAAMEFQTVAVRYEFRRLVRLDLLTEQATVLSSYPTVGHALVEFLQYSGYGEMSWIPVPLQDAIEGFTKWAQVRHTRAGAQEALNHLYRSQQAFSSLATAIERLEARLEMARAQRGERQELERTRTTVQSQLRLEQLEAARTLDPLVQAMALQRLAQRVYLHALGLLANAFEHEKPMANPLNRALSTPDGSAVGTPATSERAIAIALDGLNTYLKTAIAA